MTDETLHPEDPTAQPDETIETETVQPSAANEDAPEPHEPFALKHPVPAPAPEPKRAAAKEKEKDKKDKEEASQSPFSVTVGLVYDGPLDLLLDLIRKQNIDIYDMSPGPTRKTRAASWWSGCSSTSGSRLPPRC
jgi:segregation and condensation protein A